MEETVRYLLAYDEMELSTSRAGEELSSMQEDDETTLSDSFKNTLTLEDAPQELSSRTEDDQAASLLNFLLSEQPSPVPRFLGESLADSSSLCNSLEQLLQCVADTTREYHKVRAELNWLQRRKGKVEKKLASKQIKKLRNGPETRKRVLITSDDPITELEKKQVLFETRLLEKRKELMKVVKRLVNLKSQQPSLKLSGLIKDAQGECSRAAVEPEIQLRQPSTRTTKKQKDETPYAYPGTELASLKGTTNMDALIEEIRGMIRDVEIKYEELEFFGPRIGKGAYGEVYTARWRDRVVAVKRFPLDVQAHRRYVLMTFQREVTCLRQAKTNPHIVKFFGASLLQDCCFIVMEFMAGGSLADVLFKQGYRIGLLDSIKVALGAAEGIKLLHKEKPAIVHRDLNISNLLLREDIHTWRGGSLSGWILICDFSPVGHPRYRAPELFNADAEYTTKADVFSFGTLLYELLESKPLYAGLEDKEVTEKLASGDYPMMSASVPAVLHHLIIDCWNLDPKRRPPFKIICRKLQTVIASIAARHAEEEGSRVSWH